jgi:hypothetical protein
MLRVLGGDTTTVAFEFFLSVVSTSSWEYLTRVKGVETGKWPLLQFDTLEERLEVIFPAWITVKEQDSIFYKYLLEPILYFEFLLPFPNP